LSFPKGIRFFVIPEGNPLLCHSRRESASLSFPKGIRFFVIPEGNPLLCHSRRESASLSFPKGIRFFVIPEGNPLLHFLSSFRSGAEESASAPYPAAHKAHSNALSPNMRAWLA
jgi:hypothetical protein